MTEPLHSAAMPLVGVVMGSDSDWRIMSDASQALTDFGIAHEVEVVSAHRTPDKLVQYAREARGRGIKVIIAGAGGAAHLPGMLASMTPLPVVGVPVPLAYLDGMDSLLSIVQMPAGIPVATVSIGGARNAGILAARIIGSSDAEIADRIEEYARTLEGQVAEKNQRLKDSL
ncbi:5-(carboxyamino)imidazole ribonucleotide mutase [Microbacterium sp. ZKA21]